MSYRFPPKGTRETRLRVVAPGPGNVRPRAFEDARVLRFPAKDVLEHYFVLGEFEAGEAAQTGLWWNKLLGAAVVLGISGTFWTGVGLLINHLVR